MAGTGGSPTSTRRLVRLPEDGHIAGVCAGLARFLSVDPLLVRIAAFVLLVTGPGFLLYLAAWIFLPADDGSMLVDRVKPLPEDRHTQVVGIVLIASAIIVLSGGWWWSPSRHWLIPMGLIGLGAWLLLRTDRDAGAADPAVAVPPAPAAAPWAAAAPTSTSVVPGPPEVPGTTEAPTEADVTEAGTAGEGSPTDADATAVSASEPSGDGGGPPRPHDVTAAVPIPPPPFVPQRRRRRFLGPLVLGALLIWGGAAWLGGVDLQDGLAIALVILGGGFVLGAFVGGSRSLVVPAFVVGAALVSTSVLDIPWDGGIGDRRWEVDEVSDLDDTYELGIGQATLDLSELTLAAGRRHEVHAAVGLGELRVVVPDDLNLEITTHAGAGDLDLMGRHEDGVDVDLDRTVDGSSRWGTLELDLEVGVGHIEVVQAA